MCMYIIVDQWFLLRWWLLKFFRQHCLLQVSLELILHVIVNYFRHFIAIDGVVFWSIESVWDPAHFEWSSRPSEALKSGSLYNSFTFSSRINPLTAIYVKDKRDTRFRSIVWLLLTTWETGQSEAVIPTACLNIATPSDRNELIEAFHCCKKTKDLPWLLCS